VARQFANLDADPTTNQPEQFRAFIKSEIDKWGKVIRAANIKIE
jgi:tripartite-type tricarboxylate transporter receptor subunit TctC